MKELHRQALCQQPANPGIVVTVDLLSTGVDIPDLECIVFLRQVKSRILFEQMLGRGTRKGEKYPDKSHFTVFDCFDGTLISYFRDATAITADAPLKATRTFKEIIDDIWANRDRDYNIRCLSKRLQRIDKEMSGDARAMFESQGIPEGDVANFASNLPALLKKDFKGTMAILKAAGLQDLLVDYPRKKRTFVVAIEYEDTVASEVLIRDGSGKELKPEDYLEAFGKYVKENSSKVEAIAILLKRPKGWSTDALEELKKRLSTAPEHFTVSNLQKAHAIHYHKVLADIISMVKHAAKEQEPLLTAEERVTKGMERFTAGKTFSDDQLKWLDRIRAHLIENLSISREDFETIPVLSQAGGWVPANRAFNGRLEPLLQSLNEAVAA